MTLQGSFVIVSLLHFVGCVIMTQNLHVCTICCRSELGSGVISGLNVKTIERYLVVNFDVASSNIFRNIFLKIHFVTVAAEAYIDDSIKRFA